LYLYKCIGASQMKLALVYLDNKKGPIAFHVAPSKDISASVETALGKLLDLAEGEGFFEHNAKIGKEALSCANYMFQIESKQGRGSVEMLLLSLIVDNDQKPAVFESVLEKWANEFKNTPDLYKGFHADSDKDASKALNTIQKLVDDCYEDCRKLPEAQKPGKMIILGLQAVGKTSIINQLTLEKFNPKIKPTLGMQIIKSVIDNFKFQIYDLGGQEKIRKTWYDKTINPDAVIYVIDVSASEEQLQLAKEEFDRMCENFFSKDSDKKLPDGTPLLILGNKSDLNESFTAKKIEKYLEPSGDLNYKIGLCSALKNEGLEENFKWLVKSFLFAA